MRRVVGRMRADSVLDWARQMTDDEIKRDLDCLVDAAPEAAEKLRAYRHARMRAPHFAPGRPSACNHQYVAAESMALCEMCGSSFAAKRSDARYCQGACKKRAKRARVNA